MNGTRVEVLDKGYVRLVDVMGTDLSVVNAARVSYAKESTGFEDRDQALLNFLMREGHTSVLRHAVLSFEAYAPLMVARQWYKHAVGSTYIEDQNGWNESSRRYITEDEEFYIPGEGDWRSKPENSKQGSGENLGVSEGQFWTRELEKSQIQGVELYEAAMAAGVAPEQARLFLPANALYVRFRWTVSLAGTLEFLRQRMDSHAQYEIRQYAAAVDAFVEENFPRTYGAVNGFKSEN